MFKNALQMILTNFVTTSSFSLLLHLQIRYSKMLIESYFQKEISIILPASFCNIFLIILWIPCQLMPDGRFNLFASTSFHVFFFAPSTEMRSLNFWKRTVLSGQNSFTQKWKIKYPKTHCFLL